MPTGYTSKLVEEGQTLREFALRCARGFGATIMMRDEPMDAEIPERFEVSAVYNERMQSAMEEFNRLMNMSPEEQLEYGKELKEADISHCEKMIAKERDQDDRLRAMINEVIRWNPPGADHQEIKAFMLQQLKVSLNEMESYYEEKLEFLKFRSPQEFFDDKKYEVEDSFNCARESFNEETAAVEKRNEWLRLLRESLPEGGAQ